MEAYTAGLIIVGDEILRGQIMDTNTMYVARSLRTIGVKLCRVIVTPDIIDDIAKEVYEASKKYTVVFTSGGVGPTHDDVTYEAIAKAFNLKLELCKELIDLYSRSCPQKEEIHRLAIVPKPCELIYVNSVEDYAVVKIANVYVLPGSPKYFKPAMDKIVLQLNRGVLLHLEHIDVELNELSLAKLLDEHATRWKNCVKIGCYPQSEPYLFTRITLEGNKTDVLNAKRELLRSLPVSSIPEIKERFTVDHANSVIENSKDEKHVQSAINILEQCYDKYSSNEIFISFNGGKDCTVVLHLINTIAKLRKVSSLLCLYVRADSFPEVDDFINQAAQYYNLQLIKKEKSLHSALATLLKEKSYLKAALMGTRKGDPGSDKLDTFTITDPGWPSIMRVNPILNWTYDQVWQFLLKHKVPYCSLYDEGYTSLGTKATTIQNPLLKDPENPSNYLPAYKLTDVSTERQGRE